jgi:imidazolonepropionase-like amidohydrolase
MTGAGMSPTEALRAATINAADLLGMRDSIGSIAPGTLADIIAVSEDPMRNIKTMEHVDFVMRSGTVYLQR